MRFLNYTVEASLRRLCKPDRHSGGQYLSFFRRIWAEFHHLFSEMFEEKMHSIWWKGGKWDNGRNFKKWARSYWSKSNLSQFCSDLPGFSVHSSVITNSVSCSNTLICLIREITGLTQPFFNVFFCFSTSNFLNYGGWKIRMVATYSPNVVVTARN